MLPPLSQLYPLGAKLDFERFGSYLLEGRRTASDGPAPVLGLGVRTLAEGEGRYNPIGYHVGTVWPFDTSFVAWGLRRYGFKEEAAQIAAGILDAAEFFEGRLPEAFGGTSAR
jgi:hypothetical protein